jgi:hypothetical protein
MKTNHHINQNLHNILESLLNPVWVLLFTGEPPGKYEFLGGSIVIIDIISKGLYHQYKK